MASRKEQKEQARAARIAKEKESEVRAQRTRRIQIFGGVIVAAVIVIVVAVVVSSSGGGSKTTSTGLETGTKEQQLYSSINSLLSGIPQSGTTLGKSDAKVTMMYFGDLECPICQAFTLAVFPTFIEQEVRPGNVKVVYRSMCTATCDGVRSEALQTEQFTSQQTAAYAAGKQDKFWQFAELFYHQQEQEGTGYANDAFLTGLAKQIPGLNVQTWQTDRKDKALLAQLDADQKYAASAALQGTPTLIMTGAKGSEIVNGSYEYDGEDYGFPSASELASAVKAVS